MKGFFAVTLFIVALVAINAEENTPGEVTRPEFCALSSDPGLCLAYMPSYYYDANADECKTFIYGGCQGNENRFPTKEECEKVCKLKN